MSEAKPEPMAPALAERATSAAARDAEAMAHVQALVARSGTSFLAGMRVLPKPRLDSRIPGPVRWSLPAQSASSLLPFP